MTPSLPLAVERLWIARLLRHLCKHSLLYAKHQLSYQRIGLFFLIVPMAMVGDLGPFPCANRLRVMGGCILYRLLVTLFHADQHQRPVQKTVCRSPTAVTHWLGHACPLLQNRVSSSYDLLGMKRNAKLVNDTCAYVIARVPVLSNGRYYKMRQGSRRQDMRCVVDI